MRRHALWRIHACSRAPAVGGSARGRRGPDRGRPGRGASLRLDPHRGPSHAAASGPSAAPRFVRAHHAAQLPSGFTQVCPQPSAPGVMQCSIVVHSAASVQAANRPASGTLSPGQLRAAYGLSQAANASNKATIAIVDAYNDSHATGDLATYRSYYGLGACKMSTKCLRVVNQKGTTAWMPEGQLRLGRGGVAGPGHGLRDLPSLQDHPGRGEQHDGRRPEHRRGHRGPAGGQVHLQQLGRPRVHHRDQLRQPLQPPGRGHHRGVRRLRVRVRTQSRPSRRT